MSALTADIDAKIAALEKEMAAVPGITHQPVSQSPEPIETQYHVVQKDGDIV
jgi:hypothetical protein